MLKYRNLIFVGFAATMLLAVNTVWASTDEAKAKLTALFPKMAVDAVRPSPIKGVYEVEAGANIFYFAPNSQGNEILVFGEMLDRGGVNLTAARRKELVSRKFEAIDFTQGVTIGSGPVPVIVFTDPDCPYCRKLDNYLSARSDVTQHLFFTPLPFHKDADRKANLVLTSSSPAITWREIVEGKHDSSVSKTPEIIATQQQHPRLTQHKSLAKNLGINGTPTVYVGGTLINGADITAIERAIEKAKQNLTQQGAARAGRASAP